MKKNKNNLINGKQLSSAVSISQLPMKQSCSQPLLHNDQILQKLEILNLIRQSVNISAIMKNPLNLIQYEKEGQKSRRDPQMILAKLRKLQNRAELHRAEIQTNHLNESKYQFKKLRSLFSLQNSEKKKQIKLNYLRIYQTYLKQKEIEIELRERYEDDEDFSKQQQQIMSIQNGIKYFSSLKKYPRILNLTVSKKKAKENIFQAEKQSERRASLANAIKNPNDIESFIQQKIIQKQKQTKKFTQNPEQVIERQITKFYLKKNLGKLSSEAQNNRRSISLIQKQKQISNKIEEYKISNEGLKKLKNKFNELANQLAKSDRRKSLGKVLLQIEKSTSINQIELKSVKKKLFAGHC